MKNIVILGGGTAGTMMANQLNKKLKKGWEISIIDNQPDHYYQPGFLFIPFGTYKLNQIVKPKKDFIPKRVKFIQEKVEKIDVNNNKLILS